MFLLLIDKALTKLDLVKLKPCFSVVKSSNNFLRLDFCFLKQGFDKSLRCNIFFRSSFIRLIQNISKIKTRFYFGQC